MNRYTINRQKIREEIKYIKEHIEAIGVFLISLYKDGFLLFKNFKRETKRFKIKPLRLIYEALIKYPLLGFRVSDYFMYQFYKEPNRSNYKEYFTLFDMLKIAKKNKRMPQLLDNKLEFHIFLDGKINKTRLIADYNCKNNKITYYAKPLTDKVIIKPVWGRGGKGIKIADAVNYEKILKEYKTDCIVEDLLSQHPSINQIFKRTVNTIRIFTLKKDDNYFVGKAMMRVGQYNSVDVDNNSMGGLTIGINMEDGTLKNGFTFYKFGRGEFTSHPITKYEFINKPIPFFKETLYLAINAHKQLPMFSVIGWDIAITENGPVIIEGNSTPDVNSIQTHYPIKKELLSVL
jgi:hypothetical protein